MCMSESLPGNHYVQVINRILIVQLRVACKALAYSHKKDSPKVMTNHMDRTSMGLEILVGAINPAMHTDIGV